MQERVPELLTFRLAIKFFEGEGRNSGSAHGLRRKGRLCTWGDGNAACGGREEGRPWGRGGSLGPALADNCDAVGDELHPEVVDREVEAALFDGAKGLKDLRTIL